MLSPKDKSKSKSGKVEKGEKVKKGEKGKSDSKNPTDIGYIWPRLKRGIDKLFEAATPVEDEKLPTDPKEWMLMYSLIVQYCTSTRPGKSDYFSVRNSVDKLVSDPRVEFMGEELYTRLSNYIQNKVLRIASKCNRISNQELFLKSLTDEWIKYNKNRNWIKQAQENNKVVHTVYDLGQQQWKTYFFMSILSRLTNDILESVDFSRSRVMDIDKKQVESLIDMYTRMMFDGAADKSDASSGPLNGPDRAAGESLYNEIFIREYLKRLNAYYGTKYDELIESPLAVAVYALEDLKTECEIESVFIRGPFKESTKDRVLEIIVDKYIDLYKAGFRASLESGDEEATGIFYSVISNSRKKESFSDIFADILMESAISQGQAALDSIAQEVGANPLVFPETVINLWCKGRKLIQNSLGDSSKFINALGSSFVSILNNNTLFDKRECGQKAAEFCAKYLDFILGKQTGKSKVKKSLSKDDASNMAVTFMDLLPYINEKDTFLLFYSRLLSKRLMQNTTISIQAERAATRKMTAVCGKEYTRKLTTMFEDLDTSQELTKKFKDTPQWRSLNVGIDTSFLVLTYNSWIIPQSTSEFAVPKELSATEEAFETFYLKEKSRSKLMWQHHLSKGELTTRYFALPPSASAAAAGTPGEASGEGGGGGSGGGPDCYTIMCPAYQVAVLMYFNHFKTGTFLQLCDYTNISLQMMESVLYPLILLRIILVNGSTRFTEFTDSSVFELNPKFVGKKTKIGLALVTAPHGKKAGLSKSRGSNGDGDDDDNNDDDGKDEKSLSKSTGTPRKKAAGGAAADNGGNGGNDDDEDEGNTLEEQLKEMEQHRIMLTEAAIMRILKKAKSMAHRDLYNAASKELAVRFKPTQKVYKKSLDSLIEKEFIERLKGHSDIFYKYI